MASQQIEQPEAVGGSATEHALQSDASDVNRIDKFVERGEEILETFAASIRAFEGQALQIKTLASTVQELRKRKADNGADESIGEKSRRTTRDDSDSDDGNSTFDEVMFGAPTPTQATSDPILDNMSQFFEEEETVTDAIQEPVAKLVNKYLRRTNVDEDRMKALKDQYKRPANVECLQVPKVDRCLWRDLKNHIKSSDVAKQQTIEALNKTAGPLVTAMNHCYNNDKPDITLLKQCIADSFKFVCGSINKINMSRREVIKKDLAPQFKSLCSSETPVSATGLFGDNLPEQSKLLEASKQIKMTIKEPFLGQGRGGSSVFPRSVFPQTPNFRPRASGNSNPQQGHNRQGKQQWTNGPNAQTSQNYSPRFGSSGKSYPKKNNAPQRKQ